MIKNILHIILTILISIPTVVISQTTLDNTGGKINNLGTIRVKNGQTKALPDTIGGRVEFLQKSSTSQQMIPNIVYHQLMVANDALKLISDEYKDGGVIRSIVVRDSLIVSDSAEFTSRWIGLNSEEVHAKSTVKNTAKYLSSKDLVLNGTEKAQDVLGDGTYSRMRIENPLGADVRGGGFVVEEQLTLKQGQLRNDDANNFTMLDSSRIVRHVGADIAYEPQLENKISVHYTGTGDLTTGAEIPKEEGKLSNLYVNVSGQLNLDRNVHVEDTLEVGSYIAAVSDTLTLEGRLNPLFTAGPEVEIDGNFRRNTLTPGDTILLNSPFIWAVFRTEADKGAATALVSTIRPRTFHNLPDADEKAKRAYTLWGIDGSGNQVESGISMYLGFGWRHIAPTDREESNGLIPAEVVFQKWLGTEWFDIAPKEPPTVDFVSGWATGIVEELDEFGQFAIGLPGSVRPNYVFKASFFLEGPYISGVKGVMTHELWSRNLIRAADLKAYPTNIDLNLADDFLMQIPDSVVDIVVLEFRRERNSAPDIVKTGFLRYDGTFVDRNGNNNILLTEQDGMRPQGGRYFVAVRHRNHSAVITDQAIEISRNSDTVVYNLSDPNMIEGGSAALRLVYADNEGSQIFALKGGFVADDETGLDNQTFFLTNYTRHFEHQRAFRGFTNVGYFNEDYNLSGIVNTKDFNISWNNRGLK